MVAEFGLVRGLVAESNFAIHGVPATVTVPNGQPVQTRVIWLTPGDERMPGGASFGRVGGTKVMALRRDEVPAVPIGTAIVAPEAAGGADLNWTVDGAQSREADHHRVFVVQA